MTVATVVLALALASCAEVGEPDLGEGIGGSSTTAVVQAEPGDVAVEEVVSGTVTPVFTPTRPADYVPSILVSTDQGLISVDAEGIAEPLGTVFADLAVDFAVDDYLGGVVTQLQDSNVQWLPASAESTQLVSQGNGTLLDAGFLDATLAVQVFLTVPGGIDRIKLVDGEREQFALLEESEELIAFSSSNGIQALAVRDDQCGSLRFLNASGQAVNLGGPDQPLCPVERRPFFGAVAMSPDGGSVAYTEISYRGDGLPASTRLVVFELNTGRLLMSGDIGGPGEQIDSLSYDGQRLVFLRTGEAGRAVVMRTVSSDDETVVPDLEAVQHVSFARLPLVVAAPAEVEEEG